MANHKQVEEAFESYYQAHRAADLHTDVSDYQAGVAAWNDEHPTQARLIFQIGGKINRSADQQTALEQAVHARQTWIAEHPKVYRLDADCLRLQGNRAQGYRLVYVNPKGGGQHTVGSRDILGSTAAEAVAALRGRTAGIWDTLNAEQERERATRSA